MSENEEFDDVTEMLRQSVIETKSKKHCIRDFSGDVFELTSDMLVGEKKRPSDNNCDFSGTAECILHKYAKLLSVAR